MHEPQTCRATNRPCSGIRSRPSPYRCLHRSIVCFSVLLVLGIVGFIVGMTSYFSPPLNHEVTAHPLETRLVDVDLAECGELQVTNYSELLEVNLYILYTKPVIGEGATFSDNSTILQYTNTDPYGFAFSYYLLEGSTIDLTVHLYDANYVWVRLYLFDEDVDDKCSDAIVGPYVCSFTSEDSTCSFTNVSIPSDGNYYISLCYSSEYSHYISGYYSVLVKKLVYIPEESDIRSVCTAPCSEDIFHSSDYIMMTTSNVTRNVTWVDTVDFGWMCSDIREIGIWVSFVMLLGMFFAMLSIGFIVALCVVLCIRKRTDSDETELLLPSDEHSPVTNGASPPPQYTVASENSLRSPPPYTEQENPISLQDK